VSACSKTCGGGKKDRTRHVTKEEKYGGNCDFPLTDTADCGTAECDGGSDIASIITVCGTVKNVKDNSGVPSATVSIGEKKAESKSNGDFCIEDVQAADGTTVDAKKDKWVDGSTNLPQPLDQDINGIVVYLSQELGAKEWRIILSWGMTPLDLDARTNIGNNWNADNTDNVDCDVSYDARDVTCPKNNIGGKLDLDHCFYTEDEKYTCSKNYSPGGPSHEAKPETTTLTNVDPDKCGDDCKIVFHVSNYMVCKAWNQCDGGHYPEKDTGTLGDSKAEVTVIHGDEQVAFFELANGDGKIRYSDPYSEWWVFSIDVKTAKVTDCKDVECYPLPTN